MFGLVIKKNNCYDYGVICPSLFYYSLGLIENARKHFSLAGHGQHTDPAEWQKLQDVERHLGRLTDARKMADWKSALREADAAIAAGADSSPLVIQSQFVSNLLAFLKR